MNSSNELKKHIRLFDIISIPYNLFFKFQIKFYGSILKKHRSLFETNKNGHVLDIGCGTGAWSAALSYQGFSVIGLDYSYSMSRIAKKNKQLAIHGNALQLPFKDKSMSIVTSSYVLHGLSEELRHVLYKEAVRVASDKIIFQDYGTERNPVINFVEWLENGDYFNFIEVIEAELKNVFSQVGIVKVDKNTNWYICSP